MKMRRMLAVVLVLVMVFSLTACGAGANKKGIVGVWQIVDEETATEYGLGIEFTKDGKIRYGLTKEVLSNFTDADEDEWEDAMEGLEMLMSIKYKVKSSTEMDVTVSALFGLKKETTTVTYSLKGDTLEFDGATYSRVK